MKAMIYVIVKVRNYVFVIFVKDNLHNNKTIASDSYLGHVLLCSNPGRGRGILL